MNPRLQNLLTTLMCGTMTLSLRTYDRIGVALNVFAIIAMVVGTAWYVRGEIKDSSTKGRP